MRNFLVQKRELFLFEKASRFLLFYISFNRLIATFVPKSPTNKR